MQNPRFVVLTGHLNDYPLSDLVGILRYQKKTGRLLIEYPNGPAAFYFNEGELVDATIEKLTGLQAVCVAMAQPSSPFNFNPLIAPTRRSIENTSQRVVSELLGCWDESPLQIETPVSEKPLPRNEPLAIPETTSPESEVKALELLPSSLSTSGVTFSRVVLAMAAAGLMMLGISTVIAVTGGFKGSKTSVSKPSLMVASNSPVAVATSSPEVPAASVELNRPQSNENEIGAQKMSVASPASDSVRLHPNQRVRVTTSDLSDEPQSTLVANRASEANIRASEANTRASESNTSDIVNRKAQSVDVVMQIENGRVLQASIANPRKGMDGYEAMALRIARQRRYPAKKKGQETVKIQISPLD